MKTDWKKAKKVFGDALKLAPAKRASFLDEVCADDLKMRREVESLLSSYDGAESFLETPAIGDLAAENETKQLITGASFGHYEIIKQIGAGGMGEVYLAEDKKLDRSVAVKILNEKFAARESNLQRFVQEAKAASALNHPNILVIHEIGETENAHYIVSEFIEGKTLREIFTKKTLPLNEVLDIAIQIANALTAAHTAKIVHRDIKPENIIVRPDGFVKVLDFGLAKLIEQKAIGTEESTVKQNETAKGVILGTINYMSPEQARGERVDERTDIFSFGVLVYEMITNRTPFAANTMSETFANLINAEPPPIARYAENVPDELQRVVSKMLRKNKDERYQTMKDVFTDLKDIRQELEFQRNLECATPPQRKEAKTQITNAARTDAPHPEGRAGGKIKKPGFTIGLLILILALIGFSYWFSLSRSAIPTQIESIAVLPFVNESGNADVEYLSDGMTETLISNLSQLPKLNVKARSSVFRYKGKETDAQTIGRELNVQAILTGRVVQRGQDLTLYVELVDAATENSLWKQTYNKTMTNLVSLQSDIARDVADKLRVKLSGADEQKLAKNYTTNSEAYQLYLKGLYFWNKFPTKDYEKSRGYFEQAIDVDPTYALAFSGLSDYYGFRANNAIAPPNENWLKAEAAANKALELDASLSEAHTSLAAVKMYYYRDWDGAEREFKKALELNPNYSEAHQLYASYLFVRGRSDEGLAERKKALELEPLSVRLNRNMGRAFYWKRDYDRAIEQYQKTLELAPNDAFTHRLLGNAFEQKGMQKEAVAEWSKALRLTGDNETALMFTNDNEAALMLENTYSISGFNTAVRALWQRKLEQLNEKTRRGEDVPAMNYALAYIQLADKEQAFVWLAKAEQERNWLIFQGILDPRNDSLRDDPRFQDLLRRVGFQP